MIATIADVSGGRLASIIPQSTPGVNGGGILGHGSGTVVVSRGQVSP